MKHLLTAIACFFALSMSAQTWNPDADFDNVIGVNDLMALLSVFGSEWTANYPEDEAFDVAAYYAGTADLFECIRVCESNNARVIGIEEFALFEDSIALAVAPEDWEATLCPNGYDAYATYHRQVHLFMPSGDFRYGHLSVGTNYSCNGNGTPTISPIGLPVSPYLSFTGSGGNCFCTGLVPAVE